MSRWATAIAVVACAICIAALVEHAWSSVPSTDDYCNRVQVASHGVVGAVANTYAEWTGRLLTTSMLYAVLAIFEPFDLRPVSVVLALLFALGAMGVGALAADRSASLRAASCAVALAAGMIVLHALSGQTVFWFTGAIVYTVPLALLTAWLLSMRRALRDDDAGLGAWPGFAFGIVVGNSIELVVPIVLVYGIGAAVWIRRHGSFATFRVVCFRIAGVVAGAALLALAPGNLTRARATAGSLGADGGVLADGLRAIATTLVDIGRPLLVLVVVCFVVGIVTWRRERPRTDRTVVLEAALLATGALASLAPVLFAPAQFTPRNLLFAFAAMLAASLVVSVAAVSRVRFGAFALALLALAGAIVAAPTYRSEARVAASIRSTLEAQDAQLRDAARAGRRDVVLARVGIVPPRSVHFIELDSDATRWDNVCIALYYGVATVRREADR